MSINGTPKTLTEAEQAEFNRLWPAEKAKIDARREAGEFGRKKYKSKLFFKKLSLVEKIRGISEMLPCGHTKTQHKRMEEAVAVAEKEAGPTTKTVCELIDMAEADGNKETTNSK